MKKSFIDSHLYRGASLCCINSFLYDLYLGMFFYEWYVEWALSGGLAHYQCVFAAAVLCYWRTGHSVARRKQNTGEPILGLCFYMFVCLLVLIYRFVGVHVFFCLCVFLYWRTGRTLSSQGKQNTEEPILQGVSKKRYFLGFLSYFSSGGRILLFRMCFGIRISSPFHLATQTIHF